MPTLVLLLFGRRADLSPAAFQSHFETVHIPLIQSLVGDAFPHSHTRLYLERSEEGEHPASVLIGTEQDFAFDAAAQLVFEDEAAFKKFMAKANEPEVRQKLEDDDAKFSDRTKTRAVALKEICVTKRAA